MELSLQESIVITVHLLFMHCWHLIKILTEKLQQTKICYLHVSVRVFCALKVYLIHTVVQLDYNGLSMCVPNVQL